MNLFTFCFQEYIWSAKGLPSDSDRLGLMPHSSPLALPLTPTWEVLQVTQRVFLPLAFRKPGARGAWSARSDWPVARMHTRGARTLS
jgi:hypothetical protein